MHIFATLFAATAIAAPFTFPLLDGFPNPSQAALARIQQKAGGTLPNGPPPASLTADTLTSLRLIAFNEIFEVAFFRELLTNVTNNVPGYEVTGLSVSQDFLIETLRAVKNQEELHALNANGALEHFNAGAIQPCTYNFPVSTLTEALNLASTFTDVVLGTLQDVQAGLAAAGDFGLIPAIGSVIGQEGEQNGFYRSVLGKVPSSAPFLTRSAGPFAFTAIQSFIADKASCKAIQQIDVPTLKPLTVMTQHIAAQNQTLTFSSSGAAVDCSTQSLIYLTGQNVPVVVEIENLACKGTSCTFSASFPFDSGFNRGLTLAAIVDGKGPLADADAVAAKAVHGPGLIEVDYIGLLD